MAKPASPARVPENVTADALRLFRKVVWAYYKKHGRHDLPWRATKDVYRILVSEIMLQQTQVDRVIPYYKAFLKKFPTAKKLAAAPLSDVLTAWQGLGYNRRAKMLHAAAKKLATHAQYDPSELQLLPGVGPYTARAVAAFAFNNDGVVIETNIRTVIIHHFFEDAEKVSDADIADVLAKVLPKGKAREWYSALMDYGAHLKRQGISHNARTRGYTKQSAFAGSLRQVRGAILRRLSQGRATKVVLRGLFEKDRETQVDAALAALATEHMVRQEGRTYCLAD